MDDEREDPRRTVRRLEEELEQERQRFLAQSRLLTANIAELNDIYRVLKEKLDDLRRKDARIRGFEETLEKANKLAALGELAGSIAHEIKNPLISIQGFSERIARTEDQERIGKYAGLISREAQRLAKVLANILDFSRMNEPKREALDINGIVDDTVAFMEHHLTRFKGVTLKVTETEGLPPVAVDKIQIQQVLVNLMMNSAQAMPSGGEIGISTAAGDGVAVVSVKDSGSGISKENLARIFEPFFTTKGKGEGTGLGLSLCKRLIEANGGTIEVESEVGKGTTIRLSAPLASGVSQSTPGSGAEGPA